MMDHLTKRITITIVGAAILLSTIAAIPVMCMVNDKPAFSISIDGTSQLVTPYKTYQNPIGSSAAGFHPKTLVFPNGVGCLVWMNQTSTKLYNVGGDLKLSGTDAQYLTTRVTASVKNMTGPLGAFNSLSSWNVPTVTLDNLFQRDFCSFMDAAIDNNGHLNVFLSNQTVINGTVTSYNSYSALVWNVNTGSITYIENSTQNWVNFFAYADPGIASLSARGASGQILFQGANRHLLWNNGTHLRYKYNADAVNPLANDVYMGEGSMVLDASGVLHVVYSMGATIDGKQVMRRSKPVGGSFTSATTISAGGKECISASVFLGAGGSPNFLWSVKENSSGYLYVVKYFDGTTIHDVSNDHGGLALSGTQSPLGIIAYQARGAYLNGKLNIFYIDMTDYSDYPSTSGNLAWQYYGGATFSDNTLRIISYIFGNFDEKAFSILINDDDILVSMLSRSLASSRFNFAKVDYTAPSVVVTSPVSLDMPLSYSLTWKVSESDIATIVVKWDNKVLPGVVGTDRSVLVPQSGMGYGSHPFEVRVTDEIGHVFSIDDGMVTFTGIPLDAVITIIIIAAAAAGAILIGVYYSKNRAKIMKRNLGLKLQGKVGEDTWDEDSPVDDDSPGTDSGNVDLKKDLKKVDL